jgi:asparagine synthase (glutamine-hydrolysing)
VAVGGADELFAGSDGYSHPLWMQRRLAYVPGWLRHGVAQVAEHWLPVGLKGRNYLHGLDVDLRHSLPLLASYFDPTHRRCLLQWYPSHRFMAEKSGLPAFQKSLIFCSVQPVWISKTTLPKIFL